MVNIVGGPRMPNGASNCPCSVAAGMVRGSAPIRERPLSPCVISTVSHKPELIAAAACRTCSMNEQPPTAVPSTQLGTMPR
jgi:hypothetical protein